MHLKKKCQAFERMHQQLTLKGLSVPLGELLKKKCMEDSISLLSRKNHPIPICDEHELSFLFLQEYYKKEDVCNISHLDPGAIFRILSKATCFPDHVKKAATELSPIRNDWAHAIIFKWDEAKYQDAFVKMETLAILTPDNANLLKKLFKDKQGPAVFCEHCGKIKTSDKDAGGFICVCCDRLLAVPLRPSPNISRLDHLLNELSHQLTSGNTPETQSLIKTRENFLKSNYPTILEGRYMHPGLYISDYVEQKKGVKVYRFLEE